MKSHIAQQIFNIVNESFDKTLNEYRYNDNGRRNFYGIKNYDSYNFANNTVLKYCMDYFLLATWTKGKVTPVKATGNSNLHRAAFTAKIQSLENTNDPGTFMRVLCKIFNPVNKEYEGIAIDYNAIIDGKYNLFATIIDGSVYYLDYSSVIQYQQELGNHAVSRDGKYIYVDADFWVNEARYSYEMKPEDKANYTAEFNKYISRLSEK